MIVTLNDVNIMVRVMKEVKKLIATVLMDMKEINARIKVSLWLINSLAD